MQTGMFLYLITDGKNNFKIGIAKNPFKRLSTLNVSSPSRLSFVLLAHLPTPEDAILAEKKIHKELDSKRQNGEWFILFGFEVKALAVLFAEATLESPAKQISQRVIRPMAKKATKDEENEEIYEKAVGIILQTGIVSTSYLQRKLEIGYNRSANLIDKLEANGVIGKTADNKKFIVKSDKL